MKLKLLGLLVALPMAALFPAKAMAQRDPLRFEAGVQFSALSLNDPDLLRRHPIDPGFIGVTPGIGRRTEPGFGGRFTYNLTKAFALEAEGKPDDAAFYRAIARKLAQARGKAEG